jgi:1,4-alpha-glucan branching enzyme
VSHDEAGNAGYDKDHPDPDFDHRTHRTLVVAVRGDPAVPITGLTRKYAEARCRFAFGVTIFSAGSPMFLFGEEVGFQKDFIDDDTLILQNREDLFGDRANPDLGQRLFQFWRDAILLRRSQATLRSRNIEILHVHDVNRILVFKRWDASGEFIVLASLNNTPFNTPGYIVNHPDIWGGSQWREIFNSDASSYNGDNIGNYGATLTAQPASLEAIIPANGVVLLQRV